MKLESKQIKTCIQACINSYGGQYGKRVKLFPQIDNFIYENVEGYCGVKNKILHIVFRGSDGAGDWIDNFKFWHKENSYNDYNKLGGLSKLASKAKVHTGFYEQYEKVKSEIYNIVRINTHLKKVIITGHSLGGALATLCSLDMAINFPLREIICVTFGSPRVGNLSFARLFNKKVKNSYRYVNGDDTVCKVPMVAFNYKHVSIKIKIGKKKWWRYFSGSTDDHYPMAYKESLAIKYW
jgi:predicted lipase